MIYTDHWAFLHIPKNAGLNFRSRVPQHMVRGEQYVPENGSDTFPFSPFWHQPISYHIEHTPHLKKLPWICIVRHPEDRLASWYHFIKKRFEAQWLTIYPDDPSFEKFVVEHRIKDIDAGQWGPEETNFWALGGLWRVEDLQSNWVDVSDEIELDWFRLEDQLDELESYVGYKFSDTQLNSTDSNPYFTDEMKRVTYIQYQKDYENFGYEIR